MRAPLVIRLEAYAKHLEAQPVYPPLAPGLLREAVDALQAAEREREILLADDEVCGCLDETGERKVRIYERCDRCRALMLSDLPERLEACLIERDGALADAADFLRERDEARAHTKAILDAKDYWVGRAQTAEAELAEARERERRLREALGDYADHQAWRCEYRTRYKECQCGLDELMNDLGLPRVEVNDPEAKKPALADAGSQEGV